MSTVRDYICETCGDPVELSEEQYLACRKVAWGRLVRCAKCDPTPRPEPKKKTPAPKRQRRSTSMPGKKLVSLLTPRERDEYGVTVIVREQTSGDLMTMTNAGPAHKALALLCASIDKLPGDWKIVTVSTPGSIYGDLQGATDPERSASPEKRMLAKIGRLDLLQTRKALA